MILCLGDLDVRGVPYEMRRFSEGGWDIKEKGWFWQRYLGLVFGVRPGARGNNDATNQYFFLNYPGLGATGMGS